jgi:hypothetical protein
VLLQFATIASFARHSFATNSLHNLSIGEEAPQMETRKLDMMNRKKWIALGAVSVLAMGGAAFAVADARPLPMDADSNGAVSKVEAMAAADRMFAKMDANADGAINAADREAKMKEHFQKLDADKNGQVSEAEFLAAREARMEDRAERMAERHGAGDTRGHHGRGHGGMMGKGGRHAMAMLQAADANKDQAVSQAEFRTAAEARFAKADIDKNGSLSASEMQAQRKAMRGTPPLPPAI